MRYREILEAADKLRQRSCAAADERSRAREQLAAADKRRADAARKYQDQVAAARSAAAKARAKLSASSVPEGVENCGSEAIPAPVAEGVRSYPLRNRAGTILGWIEPVGRLLQAKDRSGTIIGWYDPRQNQTRDRTGTIVGTGDFLSALIVCKRPR